MGNLQFNGLLISRNAKTGLSLNLHSCTPTPWCEQHCYRKFRDSAMIAERGWTSTANAGPITWPTQAAAYVRTEKQLKALRREGKLEETAARFAAHCLARGIHFFRGCGTGDLCEEAVEFAVLLAAHGVRVYAFSRKPDMIAYLIDLVNAMGLQDNTAKPFVMGSIDPSTTPADAAELVRLTGILNGKPALAYATATSGEAGCIEIDRHPLRKHFRVVFGYHTNLLHTVIGHKLECPSTAGKKIKCDLCRRCYGPLLKHANVENTSEPHSARKASRETV